MTIAQLLAEKHQVFLGVATIDSHLRELYQNFLGEKLRENIDFVVMPYGIKKLLWTRQFDLIYYATDGSFFFSRARKNILHIQIPFTNKLNFWEKIKLSTWRVKNANSEFTKKVVEKAWQTKIEFVHYPTFVTSKKITQKSKIILHVGRFFKQLHSKRQDVLVDIFAKLNLKNWQLILIGSVEDAKYLAEIKNKIKQYKLEKNIKIFHNLSRKELENYYQQASIYWHATGFGVDEGEYPAKMEHFGISTVEAMAAGAVPVVINKGGQKEILLGELQDLLWETEDECVSKTLALIKDKNKLENYQKLAIKRAQDFSKEKFEQTLWEMIGK